MAIEWTKVKEEWAVFKREITLSKRKQRGFAHFWADIFVEANRHMPYTKGHWDCLYFPSVIVMPFLLPSAFIWYRYV